MNKPTEVTNEKTFYNIPIYWMFPKHTTTYFKSHR